MMEILSRLEMTFITAELGINHNGDIDIAKKLIDTAKLAGCDAVKIQVPIAAECYVPNTVVGGFYGSRPINEIIAQNENPRGPLK